MQIGTSNDGAQMGNEPTYDVFLSYNSLDRELVLRVAEELKQRKCSSFLDQWYLRPGRDWVEALERALAGSRAVAVFIGPHEMGRWQQRERVWALDQSTKRADFPVIPILLPGCEPPLGFMEQFMWIDLRDDPTDAEQLDALATSIRGEEVKLDGLKQPQALICPYRGLFAFREEDADFFFGRDGYRERLLEIVEDNPLVAVVGASGSGKSSLVSAGLIPVLRKQAEGPVWDVVRMVPNIDPLYSLAELLVPLIEPNLSGLAFEQKLGTVANDLESEKPDTPLWSLVNAVLRQQAGTERLLLFVDQWEELYTTCEKPLRRQRFIAELLEATARKDSPLTVVLTVRGDFYNEILTDRLLVDRLQAGRLDLGPMDAAELRSAIEGPAKNVGLTFEHGLVDRILKEAGEEPGRLALLEFALEGLWKRRDRKNAELTHAGYEALGRRAGQRDTHPKEEKGDCLSRAIATYAEGVYDELSDEQRAALPGLFRKLVRAGATTENDTRRRVALADLDYTTREAARVLADKRLLITTREAGGNQGELTVAAASVEVAHEELLRRWGRLKQWVDEDRKFLLWRSRLDLKVEEYQRDGVPALYQGRPLLEAKQYYPARKDDLEPNHRDFLDASVKSARRSMAIKIGSFFALFVIAAIAGLGWYHYDRHQVTERLIDSLMAGRSGVVEYWLSDLDPYQDLAIPKLHDRFSDTERDISQRAHAVYALARFDAVQFEEFQFLLDSVLKLPKDESLHLSKTLKQIHRKRALDDELGRRVDEANEAADKAKYLAMSLNLGIADRAESICTLQEDPTVRTGLIHGFKDFSADVGTVARTMELAAEPDLRSALCIAIGTIGREAKDSTGAILLALYTDAKDAATHSAARWALQQQGLQPDDLDELARKASSKHGSTSDWYVNSQKMTMLKIPGRTFRLGRVDDAENPSDNDKAEPLDSFWISDREVTVGQFQAFVEATNNQIGWRGQDERFNPTKHHPVRQVSWYDAIAYCNWLTAEENKSLSKDEQLKPYYGPDRFAVVKRLGGKGYRLPTEREWEYACRAFSTQDYCYGNDASLLPSYAVFFETKTSIGRDKMPNGWGVFDMHGNVWEWCWDTYSATSKSRVLRGGSFYYGPPYLRSAFRVKYSPEDRYLGIGFRIFRTL